MLAQALRNSIFTKRSATNSGSVFGNFLSLGTTTTIATDQALCLSALYNGVNIISNDIAILPKSVYKRDGDNKNKQPQHPVHQLIAKKPNENQTSFHFHKVMVITAILRGNAIAIIKRNTNTGGQPTLEFVQPHDIRDIKMIDNQLWFYTKTGVYHNSEVIHIKGFSTNGYTGISVLKHAAQNFNAALKAESFAETNFDSKGFGLGMIKTDKTLNPNGKQVLSSAMEGRLGKGGSYNIGVLDEGMTFDQIQVSAKEAELIDWKKITVEDVARWLNIGASKLKSTSGHNYSTMEQESLNHTADSITPWVIQFEQEYDAKLYPSNEAATHYTKFNINALLRSDIASRGAWYNQLRFAGVVSGDEIREWEDLNPTGLKHMKEPLQPVQIQQQAQITKPQDNE